MKSDTEINEAVAKALGFYSKRVTVKKALVPGIYTVWYSKNNQSIGTQIPDFCNSLDACEKWIEPQCRWWERADDGEVTVRVKDSDNKFITAYQIGRSNEKPTAKAWCLAFLKAKGIEV